MSGVNSSLRSFKPRAFRTEAFARALDRLLNLPEVALRCRALAAKFENARPIEQTCKLLEDLAVGAN